MSNFLNKTEIEEIGFERYGENLLISKDAKFYNPSKISLESNIRIDDFCILSAGKGGIQISAYVHIACYTSLIGKAPIKIGKFSNLSSRVSVYSSSDDFSGNSMTNPMVPEELKNIKSSSVLIKEHVVIGCNATILPGATLGKGTAVGAYSLVKSNCEPFHLYVGIPARKIKKRDDSFLHLSEKLKVKS